MGYPHTITIFNKYVSDDDSISYFKTKISGVLFVLDEVSSVKSTGDIGNDRVTIYIPSTSVCSKKYVDSFDFRNNPSINKNLSYTVGKGDFIGFGDLSLDGLSINEYKNSRGNLFEITGISDYNIGSYLDTKVVVAK